MSEVITLAIAGPYAVPMEGDLTTYCATYHIQVPASVGLKGNLLALATGAHNIKILLLGRNNTAKAGRARETLTSINAVSKSGYGLEAILTKHKGPPELSGGPLCLVTQLSSNLNRDAFSNHTLHFGHHSLQQIFDAGF